MKLKMEQTYGYFSCFFKRIADSVIGISGTYIDEIIRILNPEFRKQSSTITGKTVDFKRLQSTPFTFTGL